MRTLRLTLPLVALAAALWPAAAFAHGAEKAKPDALTLLTGWEFDPLFIAAGAVASWLYIAGVRRVNHRHPASPFPRRRVVFFFLGMGVLVLALISPFAAYDTSLFTVHMAQHLLLTLVAAPLLLLGTPVTLALRAASPSLRRDWLLPVLHSRVMKVLTFPVVAWLLFTAAMWGSHFSPLYNAALEHEWLHRLEHLWYLSAALFLWWQVIGLDPTPWRMGYPIRLLYLFLQMPQNSFLSIAILNSETVIYDHYASISRSWGPSALSDQEYAGITMWILGDLLFITAMGFVAYAWMQHEERVPRREDRARALARQRAAAAGPPPA